MPTTAWVTIKTNASFLPTGSDPEVRRAAKTAKSAKSGRAKRPKPVPGINHQIINSQKVIDLRIFLSGGFSLKTRMATRVATAGPTRKAGSKKSLAGRVSQYPKPLKNQSPERLKPSPK